MSSKLNFIPHFASYQEIRNEMEDDLQYRLKNRLDRTSFGRPLYYRINVQLIVTQECPFSCPFCLERRNPMAGDNDFPAQIKSLKRVLAEHPEARLTITGGEPGLYPDHVHLVTEVFKKNSNHVFCSINTAGYNTTLANLAHINLSQNDFIKTDPKLFPGCTVQTMLTEPSLDFVKKTMGQKAKNYSFRFFSCLEKQEYPIDLWNALQQDPEINIHTFRIGDFFVYATFDYNGKHARVTLGDMWQQQHNNYQDGYSNIIIHPDGRIGLNWS